ncbi:MAG TPA: DoxX family protein [Permianibacter sp.]|nr:DoxX family protein [Permianibacter sp.]
MNALFDKLSPYFNLASRILLAYIFIMAGIGKLGAEAYAGTQGYMQAMGVPGALLPLVILTELGGGLLLLVGFQARLAAFLLAGFTLISAVIFHYQPADQMQMIMFMKNLAIAGGLLLVTQYGAGAFAIDKRK